MSSLMNDDILRENQKLKDEIKSLKKELLKCKIDFEIKESHMDRVIELHNLLSPKLDIKDISKIFFNFLYRILPFDIGTIIIKKEPDDFVYQSITKGSKQIFKHLKAENSFLSFLKKEIYKTNEAVLFKNFNCLKKLKDKNIDHKITAACFAIPIICCGDTTAILIFESKTEDVYSWNEVNAVKELLNDTSLILKNALLFSKVHDMSIKDDLTELYNRRYFFDILKQQINSEKKFAIIIADIDYFKKINDEHGHVFGDKILKKISMKFKEILRSSDIIARYGGEEFIILLPDTEVNTATIIAERLRKHVESIILPKLTLSFGLAVHRVDIQENEFDVIEKADTALYTAKKFGRNKVINFDNI